MGVNRNPMSIKEFFVCPYLIFELGWDAGDASSPCNLALWVITGSFTGYNSTCWLEINLPLAAR